MIYKRLPLIFMLSLLCVVGLYSNFCGAFNGTVASPLPTLRMMTAEQVAKSIIEEEINRTDLNKLPNELRTFVELLMKYRFYYGDALVEAARLNLDSSYVSDLLSLPRISPDFPDTLGFNTPLMWAAINDNPEMINILFEHGANINKQNQFGMTALALAAEKGNYDAVATLLSKTIPLQLIGNEPSEETKSLVAAINLKNSNRMTPLMFAAQYNYPNIVELLLNKGAKLTVKDSDGRSAWIHAAANGSIDVIRFLLANYKEKIDVNEVDNNNFSAIILAADLGFKKLIELLFDHGANIGDRTYGLTPLHYISLKNYPSAPAIIELLVKRGADINDRSQNYGDTPLILAVNANSKRNITTLLKLGADITIADNEGKTALDHAQESGKKEIIALLEAAQRAK